MSPEEANDIILRQGGRREVEGHQFQLVVRCRELHAVGRKVSAKRKYVTVFEEWSTKQTRPSWRPESLSIWTSS
jgi:hypothetical protein